MTRDVFKYFTHVRSLQESTTSERAHELGYEYQSRGVWLDPTSGKRYRAQGTTFKEIPEKEVKVKPGAPAQDPQTMAQFQQSAGVQEKKPEKKEPQQQVTPLPQIPDGVSDKEFAAAQAKVWTGGRKVSKERKAFLDKMAKTQVAQMNQQAAAQAEPEEQEPEGLDDLLSDIRGEEPEKTAADFPTLDDKTKEVEMNNQAEKVGELDALMKDVRSPEDVADIQDTMFELRKLAGKQATEAVQKS